MSVKGWWCEKGFTVPFLNCGPLKLWLGVFLGGRAVAVVACCVTKMIPTWLGSFLIPWLWHRVMGIGCSDASGSKGWKLFWATLSGCLFRLLIWANSFSDFYRHLEQKKLVNVSSRSSLNSTKELHSCAVYDVEFTLYWKCLQNPGSQFQVIPECRKMRRATW